MNPNKIHPTTSYLEVEIGEEEKGDKQRERKRNRGAVRERRRDRGSKGKRGGWREEKRKRMIGEIGKGEREKARGGTDTEGGGY